VQRSCRPAPTASLSRQRPEADVHRPSAVHLRLSTSGPPSQIHFQLPLPVQQGLDPLLRLATKPVAGSLAVVHKPRMAHIPSWRLRYRPRIALHPSSCARLLRDCLATARRRPAQSLPPATAPSAWPIARTVSKLFRQTKRFGHPGNRLLERPRDWSASWRYGSCIPRNAVHARPTVQLTRAMRATSEGPPPQNVCPQRACQSSCNSARAVGPVQNRYAGGPPTSLPSRSSTIAA